MPKNSRYLKIGVLLILLFVSPKTYSQSLNQQQRNLTAFSKMYGYVQYFHPSDEASSIDWMAFAVYGCKKMLTVKDDAALVKSLNELFKTIAPTASVFLDAEKQQFDLLKFTPPDTSGFKPVYWQHYGFKLPFWTNAYKSIRINRINPLTNGQIAGSTVSLNAPLASDKLRGKKFMLNVDIDAASQHLLSLSVFNLETRQAYQAKEATALKGNKKRYIFEGQFSNQSDSIIFGIFQNTLSEVSLTAVKLQVEVDEKFIAIPLTTRMITLSALKGSSGKYVLEIKNVNHVDRPLFNKHLKIGEYTQKEIVPGIKAIVPLVLYGTKEHTFPVVDTVLLRQTKDSLFAAWPRDAQGEFSINGNQLVTRLACLVMSWNVVKHSFPYWNDASESPEKIWNKALAKAFVDETAADFLKTLKLMYAPLNDGHVFIDVNDPAVKDNWKTLPLLFAFAEDKIVVKKIRDSALASKIKIGDVLETIDGKNAIALLNEEEKYYSGSAQWKRNKGIINFLNGEDQSAVKAKFSRGGKSIELRLLRNYKADEYIPGSDRNGRESHKWLNDGVFYINLNLTTTAQHFKELEKAKSIIIDMRGYLNEMTGEFAQHLIQKTLQFADSFTVPQILYPDYENVGFTEDKDTLLPRKPYIKAKVFILLDGGAQSASESFAALYKHFKLATIVGEASSGTNGNINYISLIGGYRVSYSGMLAKNPDGSKHHLIGVLPDVVVKQTIKGIKAGRDEVLDKAIELANKKD